MITFIKQNLVLTVVVALFVFGVVYYAVFVSKGNSALLSSSSALGDQTPQSQQLLVVLANLRTIQLNQAVFVDPVYLSLSDYGVLISPEAAGRRNPFLPFAPVAARPQQQIHVPLSGKPAGSASSASTTPRGATTRAPQHVQQ